MREIKNNGAARRHGAASSPRAVTSNDVARLAGVSQTTVSRAFRTSPDVTPETRHKVMQAAETLGYRPHALARSLITGRSRIIGIVVAREYMDYFAPLFCLLADKVGEQGYNIMTFLAPENIAVPEAMVREILGYRIDGLLLASIDISSTFADECSKAGIPVVLFNRYQPGGQVSAITTDDMEGGRAAAELLLKTGHRRPAMIVGRQSTSTSVDRERGFVEALARNGMKPFGRGVGDYLAESAAKAALRLLDRPPEMRPDGIFVASETMAIAALEAVRHDLGLRVPEDVSIVGFDDGRLSAMPSFNLTTYHLPISRMIEEAADLLLGQIEDGSILPRRLTVPGHLVQRGTVAERQRVKATD